MSPQDDPTDATELGDTLRWQLRALRRDQPPTRDLWPGIAAALPARPPFAARPSSWRTPFALAASLLLAVGAVSWWQGMRAPTATGDATTLVQREADGLTRQYNAAMRELAPVSTAGSLQPTFALLDRDAALIRAALEQSPDSRVLLQQLRRTYAHRLALAQRVAYS